MAGRYKCRRQGTELTQLPARHRCQCRLLHTRLRLEVRIKPEIRAAADKELPPDIEPSDVGLLPGDGDEYVITSGALKGQRGFFTRDHSGTVVGIDLAGRFAKRTPATPER